MLYGTAEGMLLKSDPGDAVSEAVLLEVGKGGRDLERWSVSV